MMIKDLRRNKARRELFVELKEYHHLRDYWHIGHIQYVMRKINLENPCRCSNSRFCRCKHIWMEDGYNKLVIYGHYVNREGIADRVFLANHFETAWYSVNHIKRTLEINND